MILLYIYIYIFLVYVCVCVCLLYIYKELNVETRISSRSSFNSVPFDKKGIVQKKSFLFRSVPLPFL